MKRRTILIALMSICIFASMVSADTKKKPLDVRARTVKKAPVKVQPATAAKVEVKSVSPESIGIMPGDKPVTVTLTGSNLNLITSAVLVSDNWPVRGTKVMLGPVNSKKRNISFYADAKTRPINNCQLRLIAGKQTITLSADILNISVSRPPANVTRTSDTPPADTTPDDSGNTSGTADNLNTAAGTSSETNTPPPSSTPSSSGSGSAGTAESTSESTGVLKSVDPDSDTSSRTRTATDTDKIEFSYYGLQMPNGYCIPVTDFKYITSIVSRERRFDDAGTLMAPMEAPTGRVNVLITKDFGSESQKLHQMWNSHANEWRTISDEDPFTTNAHLLLDTYIAGYDGNGQGTSVFAVNKFFISQFHYTFKNNRLTEEVTLDAQSTAFEPASVSSVATETLSDRITIRESVLKISSDEIPIIFFDVAVNQSVIDWSGREIALGPFEVVVARNYGRQSRTLYNLWQSTCHVTGEERNLQDLVDTGRIVNASIECEDHNGNEVFKINLNECWISEFQYEIENGQLMEKITFISNKLSFGWTE